MDRNQRHRDLPCRQSIHKQYMSLHVVQRDRKADRLTEKDTHTFLTMLESSGQNRAWSTGLDWIEQCFTSPPTQYRLYGRRFLQVKRPNQQYQGTEGTAWSTERTCWHSWQIERRGKQSDWWRDRLCSTNHARQETPSVPTHTTQH